MELIYSSRFKKDLKKIKDTKLKNGIKLVISNLEQAQEIKNIIGIRKLESIQNTYRIKRKELQNYRITLTHEDNTIILELIRVLHRKDIY